MAHNAPDIKQMPQALVEDESNSAEYTYCKEEEDVSPASRFVKKRRDEPLVSQVCRDMVRDYL